MRTPLQTLTLILVCAVRLQTVAQDKPQKNVVAKNTVVASDQSPTTVSPRIGGDPAVDSFIIGMGDVVAVNIWKETEISRSVPVRSDGRISLPLVGEVQASGKTPKQLESEIKTKLKDYVSEPEVTVIVQEIKSRRFNILGQVARPGSYPLSNPTTILDAIALAGGFRDFAKQKSIYVLRAGADGTTSRIPFNYKDVIKGKNPGQNVKLEPRDTIYVP